MRRTGCVRNLGASLAMTAVVLLSTIAHADPNATVTGLITDPAGRAVVGATIVLTNLNCGFVYTTITNGDGIYRQNGLLPGVYRANVSKDGFKGVVKSEIQLHVQDEVDELRPSDRISQRKHDSF